MQITNQKGIAALITIVIVSIAGLIMAYSASFLGLGDLDMGYTSEKGGEAFSVADGCIEESLRRIKLDDSYSGGSFSLGDGLCEVSVSDVPPQKIIIATGSIDNFYKKIQVEIRTTGNNIQIDSWSEI